MTDHIRWLNAFWAAWAHGDLRELIGLLESNKPFPPDTREFRDLILRMLKAKQNTARGRPRLGATERIFGSSRTTGTLPLQLAAKQFKALRAAGLKRDEALAAAAEQQRVTAQALDSFLRRSRK
jgi:hypothetical protein